TSPCVLRIAGESFARPTVCRQAASNGSLDFIPCVSCSARLHFALLFEDESRHSSRVLRYRYCVRVRRGVSHPLDTSRHKDRYLCCLSSIFHRRAEVRRYRRACRKIRSPLRQYQSRAGREESLDCRRGARGEERLL